jgi:MoxR-like ATPase
MEGTYPLPEAQLDRFFMKLKVDYPTAGNMSTILNRTTRLEEPRSRAFWTGPQILDMRKTGTLGSHCSSDPGLRGTYHDGDTSEHAALESARHAICAVRLQPSRGHRLSWLEGKSARF